MLVSCTTRHVSTRHVRLVKPIHFGCVELVEQHGSTRSSRHVERVVLRCDEPSGMWALPTGLCLAVCFYCRYEPSAEQASKEEAGVWWQLWSGAGWIIRRQRESQAIARPAELCTSPRRTSSSFPFRLTESGDTVLLSFGLVVF